MDEYKCICCGVPVKRLYAEEGFSEKKPWEGMWNDGIVERIAAGYGSLLDGEMFVIAICDDCADRKVEEGILVWAGSYMNPEQATRIKLKKGQ